MPIKMVQEKKTTKVTPYDIHVPPSKENNFMNWGIDLASKIKFITIVQMLLGINRLYLLNCRVFTLWLSYVYNFFIIGITLYLIGTDDVSERIQLVFTYTNCVEYLILVLVSNFLQKKALVTLFQDIVTFDNTLNICKHAAQTIQIQRAVIFMSASIIYSIIECLIGYHMSDIEMTNSDLMAYIIVSAHDSEQIFFVTIINTILIRVQILKAHVNKVFNAKKDVNIDENIKLEALSNNAQLDTTALHRAYELLHKCAEQLNSVMSFPMIVMLFSSGLSTTILLKKFFQVTQETSNQDPSYKAIAIYTSVRCLKYTILVVIPCYYASVTSSQVAFIRTMLHNAVNTFKLDKIERRKVKAFFQLVKDNNFTYALWGVIRLSMSLPLSYASLCTTYLVIAIQFSKFID